MKSFNSKLNVWQEVNTIEALNSTEKLACPVLSTEDEKNQVPKETWFELLQYPTDYEPNGRQA